MAGIAPRACADTSGRPARDKPLKSLVWKPVPKFPIFPSGVGLERVCPSASHIGLLRIPPAVGVQSEAERRGARDSKSLVPEQQDVLGVRSDCGRSAIVRAGVDPRVWCVPCEGG